MRSVTDIDWKLWNPRVRAVICYLQVGEEVLLIRRRSGMGQNKISAPGGKLDSGETPAAAAVREMAEEVHLKVEERNLELAGRLHFHFTDDFSMLGYVYRVHAYRGEPRASSEAEPFWERWDRLPMDRMWADDPLWLPYVLAGGRINAYFLLRCDGMMHKSEVHEKLLSHRIEWGHCPPL